jgi:CheY-like chemotaxis protein
MECEAMAAKLLVTGDYWNSDFKDLIGGGQASTTLVTLDKFLLFSDPNSSSTTLDIGGEDTFDLVVIAQSRQGQFDQSLIDAVKKFAGTTPIVMMLGSWCEGEMRSDQPVEGVKRVFWHQWRGRFNAFLNHLAEADHIVAASTLEREDSSQNLCVGISAGNVESYDSLSAAIQSFGWKTRWVERTNALSLAGAINAVCIDANSVDDNLERRISWLKEQVFDVPLVLSLNFPRKNEVAKVRNLGVSDVISKPFELNDLRDAIATSVEGNPQSNRPVPVPKASLRPKKAAAMGNTGD